MPSIVRIEEAFIRNGERIVLRCLMSDGSIRSAYWRVEDYIQFSAEVSPPNEQQPLFETLDEAARAYGWDSATVERVRANMELSAMREPDDVVH